jgi:DNA-binding response OmpR family regulator
VPSTVLLVEDEVDLADAMSMALRRAGFHVVVADTGADALAAVRTQAPDAVVMDRGLPDLDGAAASAQMRAMGFPGPIVIASGYTGQLHEVTCQQSGADTVLAKPFGLAELVAVVRDLLAHREAVAASSELDAGRPMAATS